MSGRVAPSARVVDPRCAPGWCGPAPAREAVGEREVGAGKDELRLLLCSARDGDAGASEELLVRLRPRILQWVRRRVSQAIGAQAIAEDITQEVLVRISRGVRTCDAQSEEQLMSWVLTICRHAVIDWRRSRPDERWSRFALDGLAISEADSSESSTMAERLLGQFLMEAQATLSSDTQKVVVQRLLYGATWRAAGEAVGTTAGGAKRRWQRAVVRLKRDVLRRVAGIEDEELRKAVLRRLGIDHMANG